MLWNGRVGHIDKIIYSSARWCHHSLPGCKLGLVKERLLNGCWVDSFSSTSLLFSSLCSREATRPPSFSELWIAFQSRILSFLAEPEDGALQLQVSSVYILVVFFLLPYLCCEGFSSGAFPALVGWTRARETVNDGCRDTSRWTTNWVLQPGNTIKGSYISWSYVASHGEMY